MFSYLCSLMGFGGRISKTETSKTTFMAGNNGETLLGAEDKGLHNHKSYLARPGALPGKLIIQ